MAWVFSPPQGLKWILNERWCLEMLWSSKCTVCIRNPAPQAASERQDWAVHSEAFCVFCSFFFFAQPFSFFFFLPVSEVAVNAFGMTQADMCVHLCVCVCALACVCLCVRDVTVAYLCSAWITVGWAQSSPRASRCSTGLQISHRGCRFHSQ